ncbi:MAG: penicillin-binding protein 1C, partial [Desulfovibrionaceae bacterium]|nr:penicillin-binding protein 1C [Desulfovibrionaceae bacterium]
FSPKPDLAGGASGSRLFTDRKGRILRLTLTEDQKYRLPVSLGQIPADLIEATLLYEDRAFFYHPGVNPLALARAAFFMARGGRRMGGSTLTMQLARLSAKLDTRTVRGKLRQIWRALVIERHYSKREILGAYLNIAPYGANVEGVGAAARIYFHKDISRLSLPECLALATVPQHPAARHPLAVKGKALPAARKRLHALWDKRHEGSGVFAEAPLAVFAPKDLPWEAPHAVNSLLENKKNLPDSGTVRTTLDLTLQHLLERLLKRSAERGAAWGMRNASALLLDWKTGEIRALAGSADFFNAEIHGQVDGTAARRSPGSTLKPFVYALALEQGLIHPQTILADTPRTFANYDPENADGAFRGPVSAGEALRASRNIPAIALASRLSEPGIYGFLKKHGVAFAKSAQHYGLALVLGGAEVTMRELAALYAALPNNGLWRPCTLLPNSDAAVQALTPEAAFITLDMLKAPPPSGGEAEVSWKTGTSNGRRDAWTAGVFGPYVLIVWVGNFDGKPNGGFTGIHAAAPVFFDIYRALKGRGLAQEGPKSLQPLNITRIPVCEATGDVDLALCTAGPERSPGSSASHVDTWFIPGVSPIRPSGVLKELIIDNETGMRQCADIPGKTRHVIWECWPSDIRRLFRQAGRAKPAPPPLVPECRGLASAIPGKTPVITSPRRGVVYAASLSSPRRIPLQADAEDDAETIYWFADTRFLGKSTGDQPLFWMPVPGTTTIRAIDSAGRAGSMQVRVERVQ